MSETDESSSDPPSVLSSESDSRSDIVMYENGKVRILSKSSESSDFTDVEEEEEEVANTTNEFIYLPPTTNYQKQSSHLFCEVPGPKHVYQITKRPIDYFRLFFTTSLFKKMVTETNRNANHFLNSKQNLKPKSRAKVWKPVTLREMQGFVAVVLEMGLMQRPTIDSYWMKNSSDFLWFSKMFSKDRFLLLLKFFHLVDERTIPPPGHPDYDPCARFNVLIDHANTVSRQHYTPNKQLSIHEFLAETSSETLFQRYLPNKKHHKRGVKFWMLYDSITKYRLGLYCYGGAKSGVDKEEIKRKGLGYTVVEKLLSSGNYFKKGYHLYADNFCTSVEVAKSLSQRGIYLTGKIRRNDKHVPKEAKTTTVDEPKYFSNGEILMCSYRSEKSEKNPLILISTDGSMENITFPRESHHHESIITIPSMIHTYDQFMGDTDELDETLFSYIDEKRLLKFWKKVVFNIFRQMVFNAYILYKHDSANKKISRAYYTYKIIRELEAIWLRNKSFHDTSSTWR